MPRPIETTARFDCPNCGRRNESTIEVPEPNWGASDRLSDLVSVDDTELACGHCETDFQATVMNSPSGCVVSIHGHPETDVKVANVFHAADDYPDVWLDQDVPTDAADQFHKARAASSVILYEYGEGGRASSSVVSGMINRMVFVQQIVALEAYLGDTLTSRVLDSKQAILKLLRSNKDLLAEKITLAEVAQSETIVADKVRVYLKKTLYHNLALVHVLYRDALGVDILGDDAQKAALFKAVELRHDCVHRNGRDKDGKEVTLSTDYVNEVMETVLSFVNQVEERLSNPSEADKQS
jgi:hypothetical protein